MEMSVRQPKVVNSQAVYDDSGGSRDRSSIINTRFAEFRSPAMERMATAEYQKRYPEEKRSGESLAKSVRQVEWSQDKKANIIWVAAYSSEPKFAAQLANVLADCAGFLMIEKNKKQSDSAVQWLEVQVKAKRDLLDDVVSRKADLRKKLKLDSLNQQKLEISEALGQAAREISVARVEFEQLSTISAFMAELFELDSIDYDRLPAGLPRQDELNGLISRWRGVRYALEEARERYTEAHPDVVSLREDLARECARIDQFLNASSDALEKQIALLKRQIDQQEKSTREQKSKLVELEQKVVSGEIQLQRLENEFEVADNLYRSMLKRIEDARVSADENTAFTNIIREASVPKYPSSPNRGRILIFGALLGLFGGAVLVLLVEFWCDKVMLVGDLKDMGLNVLGIVPHQKDVQKRSDLATIGLNDRFSHVFEVFCGINTLVSSSRYAGYSHVVLVGSIMPEEGKTISSCNMAISAAMNGTRTLLIDGDLRRPRLAKLFGIGDEHGSLKEWLSSENDNLDLEHLVCSDVHENLDLIISRACLNTNPAELMGRARLRKLLVWARENYDRVIIDSPPMGLVGDTQALANLVDSMIVVSRLQKTKKRILKHSLERLGEMDIRVLGCIANDVPHSLAGKFQGGAYGYMGYSSYRSYGQESDHDEDSV